MNLDQTRRCFFVLLLSALSGPSIQAQSATAFDPKGQLQTSNLKGLNAVGVVVSELGADLAGSGITADQIKTDVESRLGKAGTRVLNGRERLNTAGRPYLYVIINTACSSPGELCALYVAVRIVERTHCERDSTIRTYSSTWGLEAPLMTVGKDQLGTVRNLVNELVGQFLLALQSANT